MPLQNDIEKKFFSCLLHTIAFSILYRTCKLASLQILIKIVFVDTLPRWKKEAYLPSRVNFHDCSLCGKCAFYTVITNDRTEIESVRHRRGRIEFYDGKLGIEELLLNHLFASIRTHWLSKIDNLLLLKLHYFSIQSV